MKNIILLRTPSHLSFAIFINIPFQFLAASPGNFLHILLLILYLCCHVQTLPSEFLFWGMIGCSKSLLLSFPPPFHPCIFLTCHNLLLNYQLAFTLLWPYKYSLPLTQPEQMSSFLFTNLFFVKLPHFLICSIVSEIIFVF